MLYLGLVLGYIAGAFTPSIGRKIKALLSKEAGAAKSAIEKKL